MTLTLILHIIIPILVLLGLWLMSRVPTAVKGNGLSIAAIVLAVLVTIWGVGLNSTIIILLFLLIGGVIGLQLARKVQMIQMPQMVGLLNGLGGGASMLVGLLSLVGIKEVDVLYDIVNKNMQGAQFGGATSGDVVFWVSTFEATTAVLAIVIGALTLSGSLVAAGKLHRVLPQKPIRLKAHNLYVYSSFALSLLALLMVFFYFHIGALGWIAALAVFGGLAFGLFFTLRVGGADMPITISRLS